MLHLFERLSRNKLWATTFFNKDFAILKYGVCFFFLFVFVSCTGTSQIRQHHKQSLEYFQTFNFQSNIQAVREAFHNVLREREYEILKEDELQITAINSEITSVELMTYSIERVSIVESIYAGEIELVIDLLDAPDGGTLVRLQPDLKAVLGRTAFLSNEGWKGEIVSLTSRGDLEIELFSEVARQLQEQKSLSILQTRDVELEGGFTL